MPTSRVRKRRAQRRAAHTRQARDEVLTISTADFPQLLTSRDLRRMTEAMTAEQLGDLDRALARLRGTPRPLGNAWERELTEMTELGASAEPWQWARFSVAAASRWVRTLPTPLVARVEREISAAAEGAQGWASSDYPGWVAGQAALTTAMAGMLLFDELLIEVFLVQVAPELARRAGGGRSWAETAGRVYELVGAHGVKLDLRDHADDRSLSARHVGEVVGLGPGDLVYGHLIDVPGEPGRIFAMPPIVVDDVAAQRLERLDAEEVSLEARCASLGAAVRSGDPYNPPPPDFDDEPAPRIQELMDDGLSRIEAEQLGSVEVVITIFETVGEAGRAGAYHAGIALAHRRVMTEVMRRYTRPGHEALWRALAAASHGREHARFLQLADASARSRPDVTLGRR